MLLLLLIAAIAPHKWHRYGWCNHGFLPFFAGFSLLLAGVVLMITMAVTEWQYRRRDARITALDPELIPVDTAPMGEPAPS
jgi:hypothetical protein